MERAPGGTPVGVDDPYAHVDRCDHLTDDGRCRLALATPEADPSFGESRAAADFACMVAEDDRTWRDCPHFRSTTRVDACERCGLEERRIAHDPTSRPLLEEHHLSYTGEHTLQRHEITISLCRWCHAKVHRSWGRITDDVSPDPEAIAERESRIAAEQAELAFRTAADIGTK